MKTIGEFLTIQDVIKVARYFEQVSLSSTTIQKMQKSRQAVEKVLQSERTVYGVNTGFGALATTRITKDDLIKIQHNILLSHACGVGEPLSEETVRAMMLIRANSLALGFSGVRPIVVEKICELLNKRVTPFVPAKGSVGASGDLAPLAHMALVITGEGYVLENGDKVPSSKILKEKEIEPISLAEKEGLSLVNGTQAMSANLCTAVNDALNLVYLATQVASLSADVLFSSSDAYEDVVWLARPHEGQRIIARMMKDFLEGSQLRESHRNCPRVQDAYSLRCIPQVYGAVLDTVNYVRKITQIEINSATDNPLVFNDQIISQGNFHGEPLALAADFLSIALTDLGNIIERRIDRILNPKVNEGLPPFLSQKSGINSGYMIWQYTAAALCNENKVLAHPASVDSIPTSAYQEDHVSMGMNACLKALRILENVVSLISIELMCAVKALEFRRPLRSSVQNEALADQIRPLLEDTPDDTFLNDQFLRVRNFVESKIRSVAYEWWKDHA